MADTIELELGRDVPGRAREWMRDVCATSGLDALADDAVLMVSELVTNVVLHAHTDCRIMAEFGDHVMRIEVADKDETVVRPLSKADGSERGRGLHIVAALATAWGVRYQPAGKTVWFTLAATAGVLSCSHVEEAPSADLRGRLSSPSNDPRKPQRTKRTAAHGVSTPLART